MQDQSSPGPTDQIDLEMMWLVENDEVNLLE